MMKLWCQFLDSLSTRGGSIFMLFVTCGGLGAGLLHVLHHGDSGSGATTIVSTFSGFTGALLMVLSSNGKAINGAGKPPAEPPASAQP